MKPHAPATFAPALYRMTSSNKITGAKVAGRMNFFMAEFFGRAAGPGRGHRKCSATRYAEEDATGALRQYVRNRVNC